MPTLSTPECKSVLVSTMETSLLVIIISVLVNDVEELELVDATAGGDDSEPVTELHLLEELLGPIGGGN
jgi:hypothetical protein